MAICVRSTTARWEVLAAGWVLAFAGPAGAFIIDFETDDGGNALTNGQAICTGPGGCTVGGDTVFEYGNLVDVSTTTMGPGAHMGAGSEVVALE